MRFGSVCSGIEAASQAWRPLGWKPAFFSEIEKFPSAVLAHHHPDVPNHGDMTQFQEWPDHAIDVLAGGTPCQSFSVAGLRKGLADPRGNLMLTYLAIAKRYRPRWVVWENVPGVLSSNKGRDFGTFLGALGELGYGWAYRVLDAQHIRTRRFPFAVPQRRRRVFVVGYLGDWRRAAAVLFDAQSLRGDSPPRRETGENLAAYAGRRVEECLQQGTGLAAGSGEHQRIVQRSPGACGNHAALVAPTIPSRSSAGGGLGTDFDLDGGQTAVSGIPAVSPALKARDCKGPSSDGDGDGDGDGAPILPVAFDCKGTEVQTVMDGSHPPLRSMGHLNSHTNAGGHAAVAHALRGEGFDASEDGTGRGTPLVPQSMAVRRLTPIECERLMGFPDNHTCIPYRGKPAELCPDGPRYKALGNSWAVNCADWIAERIELVEAIDKALGRDAA